LRERRARRRRSRVVAAWSGGFRFSEPGLTKNKLARWQEDLPRFGFFVFSQRRQACDPRLRDAILEPKMLMSAFFSLTHTSIYGSNYGHVMGVSVVIDSFLPVGQSRFGVSSEHGERMKIFRE